MHILHEMLGVYEYQIDDIIKKLFEKLKNDQINSQNLVTMEEYLISISGFFYQRNVSESLKTDIFHYVYEKMMIIQNSRANNHSTDNLLGRNSLSFLFVLFYFDKNNCLIYCCSIFRYYFEQFNMRNAKRKT